MARASVWDEERAGRAIPTPTLPRFNIADIDIEHEAKEAAERAAVTRTIRAGRDAWEHLGDANSFSKWCRIGAALAIGKAYALRTTGANCAWGSTYSKAFSGWMTNHGFGAMRPSDRSYAVALHENLKAIEQWRATLPDKQRRRLRGAQQAVKRWRKETQQPAESLPRWRCRGISRVPAVCCSGESAIAWASRATMASRLSRSGDAC